MGKHGGLTGALTLPVARAVPSSFRCADSLPSLHARVNMALSQQEVLHRACSRCDVGLRERGPTLGCQVAGDSLLYRSMRLVIALD